METAEKTALASSYVNAQKTANLSVKNGRGEVRAVTLTFFNAATIEQLAQDSDDVLRQYVDASDDVNIAIMGDSDTTRRSAEFATHRILSHDPMELVRTHEAVTYGDIVYASFLSYAFVPFFDRATVDRLRNAGFAVPSTLVELRARHLSEKASVDAFNRDVVFHARTYLPSCLLL